MSEQGFVLASGGQAVPFLVEAEAWEGVYRIAGKVTGDVEKVGGVLPQLLRTAGGQHVIVGQSADGGQSTAGNKFRIAADGVCEGQAGAGMEAAGILRQADGKRSLVLCATLGRSPLVDDLARQGLFEPAQIEGKREVYRIQRIRKPFADVDDLLLICGSDKRGTIYGMFSLSEYIGVSPLCYWGDAEPARRERIVLEKDIEKLSGEPSVRYRGFFINDEWPCFGNWTFSHFGGFNAQMYDHVFELLLRLKGNYLWPAMWTSSFGLDGPGSLNEELADLYGVVIGFSHHEPCLRASEEWDLVRGPESPYGNEWNFYTNREGLTRYWEDSLKRSGRYEHIITIGMRGERDSSMLGPDASMKQNIDLLKDIITTQRELIGKHVNPDITQVPQLLALYKEVEAYFYGDEETEGLKDWDGLEGVICMLCEDNFGHMRTLPTPELREKIEKQHGGFGMYYHFDYHGSPISYEWMPSTPFPKIWEQMCMAYDHGVRDVWIVNVGDLKGNEVALSYFLTLAYDFDTWGSSAPGSWEEYTQKWLAATFPETEEKVREKMACVLTGFTDINAMRRPEALHAGVYHPCHYLETDRMLERAAQLEQWNEEVYAGLGGESDHLAKDAYYSMIYYPARASLNLLKMQLYAGKNAHYAAQGRSIANEYADRVTQCIGEDRRLAAEFAAFRDGKWKGMELEQHIGFVKWNEDNCRYPLRIQVEPAYKPRLSVSRKDREEIAVKNYGTPMTIMVEDFLCEGCTEVTLEIANDGIGSLKYRIVAEETEALDKQALETGSEVQDKQAEETGSKVQDKQAEETGSKVRDEQAEETGSKVRDEQAEETGSEVQDEQALETGSKVQDEQAEETGSKVRDEQAEETGSEVQDKEAMKTRSEVPDQQTSELRVNAWLTVTPARGQVSALQEVTLRCDRSRLKAKKETVRLLVRDGETEVAVLVSARAVDTQALPPMTFLEQNGVITMEASHYAWKQDVPGGFFEVLKGYGRSGCGVKVLPSTATFKPEEEKPSITYSFWITETGEYEAEFFLAPANPVRNRQPIRFTVAASGKEAWLVQALGPDFRAGDWNDPQWCRGVLDQVRICRTALNLDSGINTLTIGALEPGLVLERILVYPADHKPLSSYLGPQESWFRQK